MILQIHVTGKCNLRCKHCYIEEHAAEMSLNDIRKTFRQFDRLIYIKTILSGKKVHGRIHLTGGEPLLHSELNEILELLKKYSRRYKIGIMSNGSFLTSDILERLKLIHLDGFQLSLDGNEDTHNYIRGKDNFRSVIRAMEQLHDFQIPCRVSFTASNVNYQQFPEIASICRKHHVTALWSDRYIPFSKNNEIAALTSEQTKNYIEILHRESENLENKRCKLNVQNYRALQFLGSNDTPYSCKAGETLITVDEKGNIFPCRRLPIRCGNIHETSISKTYFLNSIFKQLRRHKTDEKCSRCEHSNQCKGGLRCLSYAVEQSYERCDPGCFKEIE